jgi:DNA repair protein RecN (Recombination protein N)
MLTHLYIKNYALIEELSIHPHRAFNAITGETGAGKSIMLGAIGLLLGKRADKKVLFNEDEKCVVEGTFEVGAYQLQKLFEEEDLDYEAQTVIRREILANGKSRAFVNDTPVTLEVLQKIGAQLIDIHSQHDNLLLGDNLFQLKIIDAYAGHQALLERYREAFGNFTKAKKQHERLLQDSEQAKKELDYDSFLLEELEKAAFQADEQESLEEILNTLENTEEIQEKLALLIQRFGEGEWAIVDSLRQSVSLLNQIGKYAHAYSLLAERVESAWIELKEVLAELEDAAEKTEHDPAQLLQVQERLNLIYHLQKKHKVLSIAELLALQEKLSEKVQKALNFDEDIQKAALQLEAARQAMQNFASELRQNRLQVLAQIEQDLAALFVEVGMPNAVLKIALQASDFGPWGADQAQFLFSANKGIAPQEIRQVASGGEFSRLMLAIKYIMAGKAALPTLIFDEIDTGISGEIALKVGKMMYEMAQSHQIIAISHLHQIAAKSDAHYFVYKHDTDTRTISRMKQLEGEERILEIAQMIGGASPSESALLSARELLSKPV